MGKIIYFDISSDFGFFKKPDINKIYLTYNLPPKPVILGLIGSILGMSGLNKQYDETHMLKKLLDIGDMVSQDHAKVQRLIKNIDLDLVKDGLDSLDFDMRKQLLELLQKLSSTKDFDEFEKLQEIIAELESELRYPEYYAKLQHLKVGIMPLGNFPFNKIINVYNSRNSYFGSGKYDNQIISEQLLIKPKYRISVYDDDEKILNELASRISNNNPIFMPYFGKNEFIVSFENLTVINNIKKIENISSSKISSVFLKTENTQSNGEDGDGNSQSSRVITGLPQGFIFFEQYPVGYLDGGLQYDLQKIELTEYDVNNSEIDMKKGILLKINKEIIYLI